jgi:very-short-patch-repair endonuclease
MTTKKGVTKLLALRRRLRANQTSAEQLLWLKLRSKQIHGLKFRRQHEIGSYIVDFFCPERNLVIEIDGDVHATETHQINDLEREKHLKSLGLQVIRYTHDQVINNLDGVLEDLALRLSPDSTSPKPLPLSPSLQRRGRKENPKKLISILLGNIFKTCLRIPYRVSFMTGRR